MEWLVTHGGAGIFAAPGAGKTAVTLRAFAALKQAKVARRALVLATLRVAYKVWPVEAGAWVGSEWDCIKNLEVCLLHGDKKDWRLKQDADIYVVNFDGLAWLFSDAIAAADARYEVQLRAGVKNPRWELRIKEAKKFLTLGIDTLIVDESTKIKHPSTKRFKILKTVLSTFARRWILTGKPIPRSYMDLFGQIFCVDLGHALGRFITHYRSQFFTPIDRFGWNWALQKGAEERIQAAIAPYIFQLEPGDYKEIPIVENIVRVDLPEAARKIYDQLEEELLVQLDEEHVVTAVSSGVAAGKCAQVANGGLYHNATELLGGPRTWTDLHEAKSEAVLELVEELQGSPAIIVYEFKHDLVRLKKLFPEAPYVGGAVPGVAGHAKLDERDPTVDRWNRDEIPILLAHAASLAHGLNLQYGTARNVIWHSITYDRELYDQLNMRLARQGQTASSVFAHFIVAVNTVDEPKMRALRKKGKVQDNFLAALREYAKERR